MLRGCPMTITLSLNPTEEATLIAVAHEKGVSADALVHEALNKILTDAANPSAPQPLSRPIWELIQDNMKDLSPEEFAKLPSDGASEHDHYLYGHPKRTQ
jgi:hypothetical protein